MAGCRSKDALPQGTPYPRGPCTQGGPPRPCVCGEALAGGQLPGLFLVSSRVARLRVCGRPSATNRVPLAHPAWGAGQAPFSPTSHPYLTFGKRSHALCLLVSMSCAALPPQSTSSGGDTHPPDPGNHSARRAGLGAGQAPCRGPDVHQAPVPAGESSDLSRNSVVTRQWAAPHPGAGVRHRRTAPPQTGLWVLEVGGLGTGRRCEWTQGPGQ